jgi:hypothetical protein
MTEAATLDRKFGGADLSRRAVERSAVPRTFPGKTESCPATELSSRPERSAVERSAVSIWGSRTRTFRPVQIRFEKRLGSATTVYGTVALSFVIPSVPGFPTSPLSPVPLMWFSLKRTTCSWPKPQVSTGNLGEPRDPQFHGPLLETRNTLLKQNCHLACPACPGLPWGVPWDRSVPGFPATQRWTRPRVRLSLSKPHEGRQRHQIPQEIRVA